MASFRATSRPSSPPRNNGTYKLKNRWRDGTTHVVFKPLELMEKLAALIPPPRFNLVRYHGVLAPRSAWRNAVVPTGANGEKLPDPPPRHRLRPSRYYTWAELMARVFAVDVLECPDCHGPMRILAAIHPPETTIKILDHLGLPSRAPPITPAAIPASDPLFPEDDPASLLPRQETSH